MKLQTFSNIEYSGRKRKGKQEDFFEVMENIILWYELITLVSNYYPSRKRGHPPPRIEVR